MVAGIAEADGTHLARGWALPVGRAGLLRVPPRLLSHTMPGGAGWGRVRRQGPHKQPAALAREGQDRGARPARCTGQGCSPQASQALIVEHLGAGSIPPLSPSPCPQAGPQAEPQLTGGQVARSPPLTLLPPSPGTASSLDGCCQGCCWGDRSSEILRNGHSCLPGGQNAPRSLLTSLELCMHATQPASQGLA